MSFLLPIVAVGLLIAVHEFGHFAAARALGMRVDAFSIGFGPVLLAFKWGETEYRLSLLPFGGYAKIAGMAPGELPEEEPRAYLNRPAWQRALVLFAGPFVNWLVAFLLLAGLLMAGLSQPLDEPLIGAVAEGSPAEVAGLRAGDRVVAVDGKKMASWEELVGAIRASGGERMTFEYLRETRRQSAMLSTGTDGMLGIASSTVEVRTPPAQALALSFVKTGEIVGSSLASLKRLVTRESKGQLMGPLGIVDETRRAADSGMRPFLFTLVLISLALALMNLLPFPALDGGRLAFLAIESIRGKPVSPRVEGTFHAAGFALLLALILYATFGDVGRIAGRSGEAQRSEPGAPAQVTPPALPDSGGASAPE